MKYLFFTLILLISSSCLFGQTVVSGKSDTKYIRITKDPPKPPYLEIVAGSLQFNDTDKNQKIDAGETTYIRFEIYNSGLGPGLDLKVLIKETSGLRGLSFPKEHSIGTLEKEKTKAVEIPVKGLMSLSTGSASFEIKIDEANGFGTDPLLVELKTQAFKEPNVKVVDYLVSSQKGNTLQKRRPFDLQVLVQNVGQGVANDVTLTVPLPANIFCMSANEYQEIGTLKAGEKKLIEYQFVTNNEYTKNTIPFTFKINEKYGKYGEDKLLTLTMNQSVATEKLIVDGLDEEEFEIAIGSLSSDVDKNIPIINTKNPDRIALVIGNEDYSRTLNAEINVEYARHDAEIFRQYCIKMLGVEERNMHFMLDATAASMEREIDLVTELVKRIGSDAELIFYYAGHGFPDENTKVPYLIPVDVDGTNLYSAIPLSEIYKSFGETGASRITVFLDACFTGGGRNQGLLASRLIAIKPKEEAITGNMVVFSATSGEQSALSFDDERHGMFTYYLLKKLKMTKGAATYSELSGYIIKQVSIESVRINGKPQDPEVLVSPEIENLWMEWKLK